MLSIRFWAYFLAPASLTIILAGGRVAASAAGKPHQVKSRPAPPHHRVPRPAVQPVIKPAVKLGAAYLAERRHKVVEKHRRHDAEPRPETPEAG